MEYVVMAYLLGVGFIIGMFAEVVCKDTTKTLYSSPCEALLFVLFSPIIAIIWGVYIFFKGTED